MKLTFLILALILVACTTQQPTLDTPTTPRVPGSPAVVPSQPAVVPEPDTVVEPVSCKPDELLVFAAKDGREIGLADLTIEDRGTFYKVTSATIYGNSAVWSLNDITLEFTEPGAGLMEFNRQTVPLNISTECFVTDFDFNINIKDITNERLVTLTLGQGQNKAGNALVVADGMLDLKEFVG